MSNILKGVEVSYRDYPPTRRAFEWKENGRTYRLDQRVKATGRYPLCSATDVEGKRHKSFFPKGRGLIKGWEMIAEKIRGSGIKIQQEAKPVRSIRVEPRKGMEKESFNLGKNKVTSRGVSYAEAFKEGCSRVENAVWVDVGERILKEAMGTLKFYLTGRWRTQSNPTPSTQKLEVWAQMAWRLKEGIMIAYINQDLLFLEFDIPEEAKWVLKAGRKSFKGDLLQLEWWRPDVGCMRNKGVLKEAWISVVGLPLHLWHQRS